MKRFNVEQRFDDLVTSCIQLRWCAKCCSNESLCCKALLSILFLSLFHFARRAILFLQPPHKVLTVKCLMASKDSHHQGMMIIPNILGTIVTIVRIVPYHHQPNWEFGFSQSRQKTHRTIVQSGSVESKPSRVVLHDERLQSRVNHQRSTFGDGALAGLIQDLATEPAVYGEVSTVPVVWCRDMPCMECMEICHPKKNTMTCDVCVKSVTLPELTQWKFTPCI